MLTAPAISFARLDASPLGSGETITIVKGFQTSASETCVCLRESLTLAVNANRSDEAESMLSAKVAKFYIHGQQAVGLKRRQKRVPGESKTQ